MPKKTKAIKKTNEGQAWARRKMESKPYRVESREIQKSFVIICEGKNTEPAYFRSFKLGNAEVKTFGIGMSKTVLVQHAIAIKESYGDDYEYWVVFDMDIKPGQLSNQKEDVNKAVEIAEGNDIYVAFSNDAFELWFILHYEYLTSQITRNEMYKKLSSKWDCNYVKSGKRPSFCAKIYQRLQSDPKASQKDAIKNAKKLERLHNKEQFADKNPYTSVYLLVQELNHYLNND
ncbi:MAG: RloB domain-containing protein [Cryomorphaceae bacterium]|nr:MAG: RloB domain-containing protein [Cryomorphaceae bacterium]